MTERTKTSTGPVLIAAGGTGGHIIPGLTVAQALQEKGYVVEWIGTENGLEATLVPQHGIPLHTINSRGVRGHGLSRWVTTPYSLVRAYRQAKHIIQPLRPGCVVAMGGYVTSSVGFFSFTHRYPLVIHEQNSVPGLANRWLKPMANTVLQGFSNTFKANKRVITTGNPVRRELLNIDDPATRLANRQGPIRVLVFGGSQGANFLNRTVPEALAYFRVQNRPEVYHQTGHYGYEMTQKLYDSLNIDATITPYIDDMAQAYQWADLVISRAGALTVSELAATGSASLLVPYPHSTDSHQVKNGQFLTACQAAMMYQQQSLSSTRLAAIIEQLNNDRDIIKQMAVAAKQAEQADSTESIIQACIETTRRSSA